MKDYPVSETFLSFQGEGLHIGRKAFFVRMFGCTVKCPWCDSKYAWQGKPEFVKSNVQLAQEAYSSGAEIAIITGGEPCLHNLEPLLAEMSAKNIACHLETSGTLRITESIGLEFAWVALSPKLFALPTDENLKRADELKMIVSDVGELPLYEDIAKKATNAQCLWLEPEWSKASDKNLLQAIADFVVSRGGKYRAGWQMHKNYFVR